MFCSKEHEDAHAELQSQAVERLMTAKEGAHEPKPEATRADPFSELERVELAPAAMTAQLQDSARRVASVANPKGVTPRPTPPPMAPAYPRFALADDIKVPISVSEIASPDLFRRPDSAFAYDLRNPLLPAELVALLTPALEDLPVFLLPGPDPAVPPVPLLAESSPVRPEPPSSIQLPSHAADVLARTLRTGEPIRIATPPNRGRVTVESGSACLDTVATVMPKGAAATLSLQMASPISCGEWLRLTDAPMPALKRKEQDWAESEIELELPVRRIETPTSFLNLAGFVELEQSRGTQGRAGVRAVEPLETLADPQFPCTPAFCPVLRGGARRPIEPEAAQSGPAISRMEGIFPSGENGIRIPPMNGAPESEPATPEFAIGRLIGSPIGPHATDCMADMPAVLLVLKRIQGKNGGHRASQLPEFKSIPMNPLPASAGFVWSIRPLRLARAMVAVAGGGRAR
jgi:hypothetical protein